MKRSLKIVLILLISSISFPFWSLAGLALNVSVPAIKARGSTEYSPDTAWEMGFTGKDVVVAVIDTGVDDEHEDLRGKFVAGADFTENESLLYPRDGSKNPDDESGHGTHCAGIIMGTGKGSSGAYTGVAPDAKLLDIKVLDEPTVIRKDVYSLVEHGNLTDALDWLVQSKDEYGVRAFSVSIEANAGSKGDDMASISINDAVSSGMVGIVAAGNSGPENDGFFGISAADRAITVGAIDDHRTVDRSDDSIADFSNRGPRADDGDDDPFDELKPDIVAPGMEICTCRHGSVHPALQYTANSSGTSAACPHISGIVALMLEANPELTPEHVKRILQITAEKRGEATFPEIHPKWNRDYGYGIVDGYRAVKMATETDARTTDPYQIVYISSMDEDTILTGPTTLSGRAFKRNGAIDSIEIRMDDGEWRDTTFYGQGNWYHWNFRLDAVRYGNGDHWVHVRSGSNALNSLEYSMKVTIDHGITEESELEVEGTKKDEEDDGKATAMDAGTDGTMDGETSGGDIIDAETAEAASPEERPVFMIPLVIAGATFSLLSLAVLLLLKIPLKKRSYRKRPADLSGRND